MPLVRISHVSGKPASLATKLARGVHRDGGDVQISRRQRFQIVTSHEGPGGIVGPNEFLGMAHPADLVFIQITCADGRSVDQKKALSAAIAGRLSQDTGVRSEEVITNLMETRRGNWSLGHGLAPLAN